MTVIQKINLLGCVLTIAVAMFAVFRMKLQGEKSKRTEIQIVLAFPTIAGGMAGWIYGYFWPAGWTDAFDAMVLWGILSLMLGSRKHTEWVAPLVMKRLSIAACAFGWLTFLIGIS